MAQLVDLAGDCFDAADLGGEAHPFGTLPVVFQVGWVNNYLLAAVSRFQLDELLGLVDWAAAAGPCVRCCAEGVVYLLVADIEVGEVGGRAAQVAYSSERNLSSLEVVALASWKVPFLFRDLPYSFLQLFTFLLLLLLSFC